MPSLSARACLIALALSLAGALAFPDDAAAQCKGPGGTCGLFGGSCCSGSSCVVGFCVANCAGEGGLCATSSGCCGNRVCALGFCQTPRNLGQACGPGFPCASGLSCDPLAGFRCVDQTAQLGEACGPLVQCAGGLSCDPLAGFRCVDQTAQLGEACGPLVQCSGGLVCDPLAGFVCVDQTADLGQACGPLVQCESGLVCDPVAGFVCVDKSAGEGQACGPLVQCESGLACDPLAGFRCVDTTPSVGQPCGPAFPCNDGLVCDPVAGFVCVDRSSSEGQACGPLVQCDDGLFCDPLAGFRCVSAAGVDQACGPGVPCAGDLQCSLALRCSHEPAQAGETCDATAPCGEGLYCQPGIPQRCQELRKPGEGCSVANPCVAGASCEACFTEGCNAPYQCFPNANRGAITEQQCRALHSPGVAASITGGPLAYTVSAGNGIGAVATESQAFGMAYGPDGRYGCYTGLCGGIFTDVAITGGFVSFGFYGSFDAVGGSSFVNVQSTQTPFKLLSFSTSQVFERFGNDFPPITGSLIGTEDALALGAGLNPSPFTAGSFYCETVLDTVIAPGMGDPPTTLAVAAPAVRNPGFVVDLDGWTCLGEGDCVLADDDALGRPNSGSGQVTSPVPGVDPGIAYLASACTSVVPDQPYEIAAWVKTLGARPGTLTAWWNTGLDCDGALAHSDVLGVSDPDGVWRQLTTQRTAPGGAQSVQLLVSAERDTNSGAASTSRIDAVMIPEPGTGAGIGAASLALAALALGRRRAATPSAGSPRSAPSRRDTPRPS